MLKIIVFVKSFIVPLYKKIHKVMLSDVIVNIFNSHMTLYLNILKAPGFYILLRLFPFSQNRQGILTRLFFHDTKYKCPGLNCLPPKKFTEKFMKIIEFTEKFMKINKYILISLITFQCADTTHIISLSHLTSPIPHTKRQFFSHMYFYLSEGSGEGADL